MDRRIQNIPNRTRNERPQRPQRIQRRINRQIPRNNRRIIPRRDRLERIRNTRPMGRFQRFNNLNQRRMNLLRRTIFVGRLPFRINDDMLHRLFRFEGKIISARIIKDFNGRSKGFGFIEFENPRDAFRCINKWNNTFLQGQIIKVHYPIRRRRINNGNNGRFAPRGRFGFRGQRRGMIRPGRLVNRGRRY